MLIVLPASTDGSGGSSSGKFSDNFNLDFLRLGQRNKGEGSSQFQFNPSVTNPLFGILIIKMIMRPPIAIPLVSTFPYFSLSKQIYRVLGSVVRGRMFNARALCCLVPWRS